MPEILDQAQIRAALDERAAIVRRLGAKQRLASDVIALAVRYATNRLMFMTGKLPASQTAIDAALDRHGIVPAAAPAKVATPAKPAASAKAIAVTKRAAPAKAAATKPALAKPDRMASWRATQAKILQAMGRIPASSPKTASRSAAPAATPPKVSARMASWRATQDEILRELGRVSR